MRTWKDHFCGQEEAEEALMPLMLALLYALVRMNVPVPANVPVPVPVPAFACCECVVEPDLQLQYNPKREKWLHRIPDHSWPVEWQQIHVFGASISCIVAFPGVPIEMLVFLELMLVMMMAAALLSVEWHQYQQLQYHQQYMPIVQKVQQQYVYVC